MKIMDSLHTFNIEVRPSAAEQVSKPPCKGLCKDCKKAANIATEPLTAPMQNVASANDRD